MAPVLPPFTATDTPINASPAESATCPFTVMVPACSTVATPVVDVSAASMGVAPNTASQTNVCANFCLRAFIKQCHKFSFISILYDLMMPQMSNLCR